MGSRRSVARTVLARLDAVDLDAGTALAYLVPCVPVRANRALPLSAASLLLALCVGCAADPAPPQGTSAMPETPTPEVTPELNAGRPETAPAPTERDQATTRPVPVPSDWDVAQDCQIEGVAVGGGHACARTTHGHVYCWGRNDSYQLGAAARGRCTPDKFGLPCSDAPLPVSGLHNVVDLALTNTESCALDRDGRVLCWGSSESSVYGSARCTSPGPTPTPSSLPCRATPVAVAGAGKAVSLGGWGTLCAAQSDGTVKGWVAHMGALPTAIPGVADAVQTDFQCARTRDGKVQCWWCNNFGQRGDGSLGPAQEVGVPSNCQLTSSTVAWQGKAVDISSGYDHACLVEESGAVACWGDARGGQLGVPPAELPDCNGKGACATQPVRMRGVDDAVEVSAGYAFTCVRRTHGEVSCTTQAGTLRPVPLPEPALQIAARYADACAVVRGGRVFCWQANGSTPKEIIFCGVTPGP